MFKTVIAGVTALSLTLSSATPTHAGGLSEDDIGKLLFGLVAAVTIGTAIKNNDRQRRQAQTVIPQIEEPLISHRSQRRLPRRCVENVETHWGQQRILGRDCLNQRYRHAARLPQDCAVRVFTNSGPRNGFDLRCLRDEGFRIRRNGS